MLSLSDAPEGECYEVKWNLNRGRGLELTQRFGIVPGARLRVVGSCFGSVIVDVEGRRVVMDRNVAGEIKV